MFRCSCCGFRLPASYEDRAENSRCFLCEPMSEEQRKILEREYSASRKRMRRRIALLGAAL